MKNLKNYQRGLIKGFKATNSQIPKGKSIYYRLGYSKGQEIQSEFYSMQILLETFLPKN